MDRFDKYSLMFCVALLILHAHLSNTTQAAQAEALEELTFHHNGLAADYAKHKYAPLWKRILRLA